MREGKLRMYILKLYKHKSRSQKDEELNKELLLLKHLLGNLQLHI